MTNRELASLGIKLVGLYCLIQVVARVAGFSYSLLSGQAKMPALGLFFGVFLVFVALGVLLIWKSERFVHLALPRAERSSHEGSEPPRLQAVFFSVVGVVLIVQALPSVTLFVARHWIEESPPFGWQWPHLAALLVQVVLGVALFLGSAGLTRIWRRINQMNQAP